MAKKLLIVCALLALISTSLFAQYDMKAPLPMDPNVRIGKLANGLTYYIRHNAEPKERASFTSSKTWELSWKMMIKTV